MSVPEELILDIVNAYQEIEYKLEHEDKESIHQYSQSDIVEMIIEYMEGEK